MQAPVGDVEHFMYILWLYTKTVKGAGSEKPMPMPEGLVFQARTTFLLFTKEFAELMVTIENVLF